MAGLSAGLYPLIYLYTSNHTLITSWYQFLFLILGFIGLPIMSFLGLCFVSKQIGIIRKYHLQIFSFLNVSVFAGLLVYSTYGFKKKILLVVCLIAFALTFVLFKYIKRVIQLQFILALVGLIFLVPTLYRYFSYDDKWLSQPDKIEAVKFKKKPNIYLIQPDGYVGLSELPRGNYSQDNSDFSKFLSENNFKVYPNFRSNYFSTLSSNSSMFAMKHHYYNGTANINKELLYARDVIVSENPVLSIFKTNGYATSLILEKPYLLANRPKLGYDYCNISYDDLPIIIKDVGFKRDVNSALETAIKSNRKENNFYFVERIIPGHISTWKSSSEGKDLEREKYLNRLKEANLWLKGTISLINKYDSDALIIIAADHGGFVGYDYSTQSSEKPKNRDNTFSMFSSLLAIKWPENPNQYDKDLKTSVNLFRTLFTYLSEDKSLLRNLQDDRSYLAVDKNAPLGIYVVIDENDNAVFKTLESSEK
ncbi:hypothetical protein CA834_06060 [Winogradskyella aurantia]|uniref:Sulfatase N-terminal domain-containing protein n=1 Tax=Winogradskyella aurantia TaxID=1915063 RepID=A0A265UUN7_9FLAO|nr:hypothetical protein CA834_06060 [Winogradskyella aurantia]